MRPEYLRNDFSPELIAAVTASLDAAWVGDWKRAATALEPLDQETLKHLGTIFRRFYPRVWEVEAAKRPKRKLLGAEDAAKMLGISTCGREGHPRERMWLTRTMIHCPDCRIAFSRKAHPELDAEVLAVNPTVHCRHWKPGDPSDRFHSPACGWKAPSLSVVEGDGVRT